MAFIGTQSPNVYRLDLINDLLPKDNRPNRVAHGHGLEHGTKPKDSPSTTDECTHIDPCTPDAAIKLPTAAPTHANTRTQTNPHRPPRHTPDSHMTYPITYRGHLIKAIDIAKIKSSPQPTSRDTTATSTQSTLESLRARERDRKGMTYPWNGPKHPCNLLQAESPPPRLRCAQNNRINGIGGPGSNAIAPPPHISIVNVHGTLNTPLPTQPRKDTLTCHQRY